MSTADTPDASAARGPTAAQTEAADLRRFLGALRATWRIPCLAAAFALILGLAALGVSSALLPTMTTFIAQFHFTFPTAQAGRYPNGVAFSINDILDPAIIAAVYRDLEVGQYGLDQERFYTGFSIRPFVLTESEDRIRQQLLDRRLSFVERERLEQQLRNQLDREARGGAELAFSVRGRIRIPLEAGRAIVQRVPFEWARQAIENKGVLRIAGFSATDSVITPDRIKQLPLPLRIVAVLRAGQMIEARLQGLDETTGIFTARDPVGGKSIRDLGRDLRDFELYQLNPLRAALVSSTFHDARPAVDQVIEQRIRDIDIAIEDAKAEAAAVADMLAQYVQDSAGLHGAAVEKRASSPPSAAADAAIAQVGEGFIDRIIALTRRDRDVEQAQEALLSSRVQAQLDLNLRAIALRSEQGRWKDLLADLRAADTERKELDEAALGRIDDAVGRAGAAANSIWAAVSRVEAEFSGNRTGRTGEIYAAYNPRQDVVSENGMYSATAVGAVVSASIMVFIGFWLVRAFLLLAGKPAPARPTS